MENCSAPADPISAQAPSLLETVRGHPSDLSRRSWQSRPATGEWRTRVCRLETAADQTPLCRVVGLPQAPRLSPANSTVYVRFARASARSAASTTCRPRSGSGSGNRRARRRADRTAGTAGRSTSTDSVASIAARATAPIAPATSVRTARRWAPCWSRRCAAVRCRRRCTAPRDRTARAARPAKTRRIQSTRSRSAGASRPRAPSTTRAAASRSDGPGRDDDAASGVGRRAPRPLGKRALRPAPKRVAGADVHDDEPIGRRHTGAREPSGDARGRRGIDGHLHRDRARGSGGAMPSGVSRSHWFSTAWRGRSSRGRATRDRVHPARPATS